MCNKACWKMSLSIPLVCVKAFAAKGGERGGRGVSEVKIRLFHGLLFEEVKHTHVIQSEVIIQQTIFLFTSQPIQTPAFAYTPTPFGINRKAIGVGQCLSTQIQKWQCKWHQL